MAASTFKKLTLCFFFSVLFLTLSSTSTEAHADDKSLKLIADVAEWPLSVAMYGGLDEDEDDEDDGLVGLVSDEGKMDRRSLFWRRFHYYISYGALSANRIPCPPRSGRSYYTHNCFKARTPVNPYSRGCSRITRCRR